MQSWSTTPQENFEKAKTKQNNNDIVLAKRECDSAACPRCAMTEVKGVG